MGLINRVARLESPFNPRVHIYNALVQAGENDPHRCVFLTRAGLDTPRILQNDHGFMMPDDPSFVETEYRNIKWGSRTADVHVIEAIDDPASSEFKEIELPDEATGIYYPRESEATEEQLAVLTGEA